MKIRMSNYATFNRRYASWPAFYEEFGPIAKSKDSKTFWNMSSLLKMMNYI
jgi:hypothetical protein